MVLTVIIVFIIAIGMIGAVNRIIKDRKKGKSCSGSCSGCIEKSYCSK
ncbi:FeoB-associated Cys-rich membrane protein [Clostridium estertheticum]|nr:FeoB-associated Cys-rich membrane protein [Clostridium estertheticum]MBU3216536.1 FeoB-associated Cys-rich membrane protein [Clostridium estertheticum]WAG54479.1 FeoB-associated Cys-rich membrane protein [Clostridium estertheticum]